MSFQAPFKAAGNWFLRAAIHADSEQLKLDPETYLEVMTLHLQSARIFTQNVKDQAPELCSR
jgi:hypothetical protein